MTQYRQILRLHSQGISQRSIARSCQCSRNTVASVLHRASAANLTWPLDVETDADLERLLFPEKQEHVSLRRMAAMHNTSGRYAQFMRRQCTTVAEVAEKIPALTVRSTGSAPPEWWLSHAGHPAPKRRNIQINRF